MIRIATSCLVVDGLWVQAAHAADSSVAPVAPVQRRIPDTIMFTIDELNDIQSRVAAINSQGEDGANKNSDAIEEATLYLQTILYYGPTDWTIWLNGVPIGPKEEFQAFKVTGITPNYVELLVPLSAQGMRPVRLAPNQTFVAKTGTVMEGPWR